MSKIYLASSWKNAELVKYFKGELQANGHEVDAFCDPEAGRFVFSFDKLPKVEEMNAQTVLQESIVKRAFYEDKKWLDWADTVLLILPAGKSAHLEAGYAAGAGKRLIIYQDEFPAGDFDVMYGFADLITSYLSEVIDFLKTRRMQVSIAQLPEHEFERLDEQITVYLEETDGEDGLNYEVAAALPPFLIGYTAAWNEVERLSAELERVQRSALQNLDLAVRSSRDITRLRNHLQETRNEMMKRQSFYQGEIRAIQKELNASLRQVAISWTPFPDIPLSEHTKYIVSDGRSTGFGYYYFEDEQHWTTEDMSPVDGPDVTHYAVINLPADGPHHE
ncbi:hypothetical protein [Paenibacillus monticola]|uniref:hypothetical protein n=1 Tax=Paenibacillus monticola TaxID=2666075 RepID=UPI00189E629F|nr:hypothetical protein [Paenibacillus monticola]